MLGFSMPETFSKNMYSPVTVYFPTLNCLIWRERVKLIIPAKCIVLLQHFNRLAQNTYSVIKLSVNL